MLSVSDQKVPSCSQKTNNNHHHRAVDYTAVVAGLRVAEPSAFAEFTRIFRDGVCFFLSRSGASHSDLGGLTDECLLRVHAQILQGVHLDPVDLPRFVFTTTKTMMPGGFASPIVKPAEREHAARVVAQMSNRGRKALKAYLVEGESRASICSRLRITEAKFEAYKAESKLLFGSTSGINGWLHCETKVS